MPVAVLSLCEIIASRVVSAVTLPASSGGLNTGAPGDHTLSSRFSSSSSVASSAST
jgi:hypothetical protein